MMALHRRAYSSAALVLRAVLAAIGLLTLGIGASHAHEVRPAYLEMTETAPGRLDVLFKTPMRGELRLALSVQFSGKVMATTPTSARIAHDALIETWQIRADESLAGQKLRLLGLENTMTDALVRIAFADGRSWVQRLTPAQPEAWIPAKPAAWQVARTYLLLGIEHILLGIDHLLFVFVLLLLAGATRSLIAAITAFTIAHSITLAAASLGYVHAPSKPIEAAIALSIAFAAAEVLRARAGNGGLAARLPWLAAFGFGLLHGFGFAGALSEIGLPVGQIPLALLFFNLGVEAGQVLFVAAMLGLAALIRAVRFQAPRWAMSATAYLIGTLAIAWTLQRVAAF